ncbi:P-loop containing nucleoside triphosphate hydrolase protein [Hortaea werneckii]|uniref:AAA+ ATPase domain-containing protein n=2 Tax=Hortaea werneckii TaxID=91943 RepID=A0A1Z5T9X4_HORWE|nr:P-loop containing nucleoside triphosphate hydrolase protein [Hortaea werneckii]OTA32837.1 hypothetical protein BTJ68_06845 [Hortaea werneckii EXF-2000]KAI6819449.1 P-loop containing nucleoside triphosphate hydrolase protein [Hortaea werneckii]KAI6918118.1 P-loop containing nucleoside triphosphate hydrolase protein [Hortaea werneckii]KAI6977180.1 P-loop containing nucleoside triphosphate hydrolase protein [Hortaea werneckii]
MVLQGSAQRLDRLKNIFFAFINGKRTVSPGNEAVLFIESICAQEDKRLCIEKLASSSHGLETLRTSMRMQLVDEFINGAATNFILYLDDPAIELLCAGDLRKKVLDTMLNPPTFWNEFVAAAMTKRLRGKAEYAFSWVLLLLLCWTDSPLEIDSIAQEMVDLKPFHESADEATKKLANRIEHALAAKHAKLPALASGPGGRHDNDKVDFRQISLFQTQQELACKEKPYYRRADDLETVPMASRVHAHLDNQSRLLREDFLAELREEVNVASKINVPCRNMRLRGLEFLGTYFGDDRFATPFAMVFSVRHGLEAFANLPENQRKAHLNNNPKFLPREAFGCIIQGGEVVIFATLLRAEEPLMEEVPAVTLVVPGTEALERVLSCVSGSSSLDFVLMSTPVFAYEPILRCLQTKLELPLSELLLSTNEDERVEDGLTSEITPCDLTEALLHSRTNVQNILNLPKPVQLDESQLESLVAGLRQSVSLIQGPPGTGKSFTGAPLAKALFDNTNESILVLCYTNHALDQFLEDLIDIGIDQSSMVRLGSKSSGKTEPLSLRNRTRGFSHPFDVINDLRNTMNEQKAAIEESLTDCLQYRANTADMLSYLEFAEDDWAFFYAFKTPGMGENEEIVGPKGKKVTQTYVFDRWLQGKDAGIFVDQVHESHDYVWQMDREARRAKWTEWEAEQRKELLTKVNEAVKSYNESEALLRKAWTQQHGQIIRDKRIVACTTTAAAKYTEHIQSASPGVILVEEAGEILESYVLTAMTPSVRQLILIGDHQQLRPKAKAYALSVEKGDGYDLNRSLFERLILAGLPHTTLQEQYRMCPEISSLVRHLGYPSLRDAPSTLKREPVRGIDSRVVFIDHRKPERAASQIADRRDQGATVSKQNQWEVAMVLKIVRYMAQQGYGTSDQVVLTPYLGQLHLLRNELAKENDPVLNDLDSFDLVQAGLMIAASAAHNKRPISISTIDNYQGEESDIVIVSLTRSNANGDIGFMSSPERLNVLLSRARKALILIGNSETFMARTKGAATWKPLFDTLASNGDMHDGLPVSCSQHPNWHRVMTEPSDFEKHCPDGGCSEPCGIDLACKIHKCPQKCHKAVDHSKLKCKQYVHDQCPKGHTIAWQCFTLRPSSCSTCDTEARRLYKKQQRDLALENERQARQQAYKKQLAEIDDEIDRQRRLLKDHQDEVDRRNTIDQRMQDLQNVQSRVQQQKDATISQVTRDAVSENDPAHNSSASASAPSSTPANTKGTTPLPPSLARDDWDRQKQLDGAKNAALDKLMAMTGLENVKQTFLDIKASIDLKVRQNADMSKQRFSAALLGNPDTGKTTVARLYAEFLTTVGALPGDHVIETTGSKLANEGVSGCKKMIEDIQNTGGGALFIDEAYLLSSGSSYGGSLENFGNGRDVKTLAKSISSDLLSSDEAGDLCPVVTEDSVTSALEKMTSERTTRAEHAVAGALRDLAGQAAQLQHQHPSPHSHAQTPTHTAVSQQAAQKQHEEEPSPSPQAEVGEDPCNIPSTAAVRDAGVSDAIWQQLQRDKLKVVEEARELERLADEERRLNEWLKECADAEKARKLAEIERKKKELEERKRQEAAEQEKLMQRGLCPVGYRWIRQSGGYRQLMRGLANVLLLHLALPFEVLTAYIPAPIRGVNLGGWFVTEQWITPSLYRSTDADDEWGLCNKLGKDRCSSHLHDHWSSFFSRDDFEDMAAAGLNTVRIPLGYWAVDVNGYEPYVSGQYPYLIRAVNWASEFGMRVLIDLHGAPGSQNGQDNSGLIGPVLFPSNETNADRSIRVLRNLTEEFSRDVYGSTVMGIELLNEPRLSSNGTDDDFPMDQLKLFYADASRAVRRANSDESMNVTIHDAFWGPGYWVNYNPTDSDASSPARRLTVDTHQYYAFAQQASYDHDQILESICNISTELKQPQAQTGIPPTIVGEFSLQTGDSNPHGDHDSDDDQEQRTWYRLFFESQIVGYSPNAEGQSSIGWIYWTWKTEYDIDTWSYRRGLQDGYIPADVSNASALAYPLRENGCVDAGFDYTAPDAATGLSTPSALFIGLVSFISILLCCRC